MKVKLGINGFGRIGRMVIRCLKYHPELEVAAINDLCSPDTLAYMLKYDSTHGLFAGGVTADEKHLIINGRKIPVFSEKSPENIPWGDTGVQYIVEASGHFLTREKAQGHIKAGADYVVMSAPAKDDTPMFVFGVNDNKYEQKMNIVSNASCTTNALAPLSKAIHEHFGISQALMTTVHAYTATQKLVDGTSGKDLRGGRAAACNIIPSSTGAAKAVGKVIPELSGKLTGLSMRVPVSDVSVVDLTAQLERETSYDEICTVLKELSLGSMDGILGYIDEPVVSSDFIGDRRSCIFDAKAGIMLNSRFVKLIAWYDNEVGYADRLLCLIEKMAEKNKR